MLFHLAPRVLFFEFADRVESDLSASTCIGMPNGRFAHYSHGPSVRYAYDVSGTGGDGREVKGVPAMETANYI